MKTAREVAGKILNAYLDYGKATPAYTLAIIEAIAQYPAEVQLALSAPITGIQAKCKFLPTVAEIVEVAEAAQSEILKRAEFGRRYPPHRTTYSAPRIVQVHRPFPQLWAAFGHEFMDEHCRQYHPHFEVLSAACMALVTQGPGTARGILGLDAPDNRAAETHG